MDATWMQHENRTSVEMIEKDYAAHLKDMIDTSLVNVRKAKPPKGRPQPG